jgi:DNA-binding Xre family transcriptional regulator
MISYEPLFKSLREKGMVISDLRGNVLHPTTIAKIYKGEYVDLETIDKICVYLNVGIEDVIEIKK